MSCSLNGSRGTDQDHDQEPGHGDLIDIMKILRGEDDEERLGEEGEVHRGKGGGQEGGQGQAVVNNNQFQAMMDSVQRLEAQQQAQMQQQQQLQQALQWQQQAPQGAHYPGVQRPEGGALYKDMEELLRQKKQQMMDQKSREMERRENQERKRMMEAQEKKQKLEEQGRQKMLMEVIKMMEMKGGEEDEERRGEQNRRRLEDELQELKTEVRQLKGQVWRREGPQQGQQMQQMGKGLGPMGPGKGQGAHHIIRWRDPVARGTPLQEPGGHTEPGMAPPWLGSALLMCLG